MPHLYFAYASNMEPRRFRRICPRGAFVGPARLPGYRLAFSRYSSQRRGGSADVVPDAESDVWGMLYEVKDADLIKIGEAKLKEEIEQTLKWIKLKGILKSISRSVSSLKIDYEKEVLTIRKKAWSEYRKALPL